MFDNIVLAILLILLYVFLQQDTFQNMEFFENQELDDIWCANELYDSSEGTCITHRSNNQEMWSHYQ